MAQQSLVDRGLLITEAPQSLSDTLRSVRFLWTCDQPEAETSTTQHTTLTRHRYPCATGDIRTRNPSSERQQTHAFCIRDCLLLRHVPIFRST